MVTIRRHQAPQPSIHRSCGALKLGIAHTRCIVYLWQRRGESENAHHCIVVFSVAYMYNINDYKTSALPRMVIIVITASAILHKFSIVFLRGGRSQ